MLDSVLERDSDLQWMKKRQQYLIQFEKWGLVFTEDCKRNNSTPHSSEKRTNIQNGVKIIKQYSIVFSKGKRVNNSPYSSEKRTEIHVV